LFRQRTVAAFNLRLVFARRVAVSDRVFARPAWDFATFAVLLLRDAAHEFTRVAQLISRATRPNTTGGVSLSRHLSSRSPITI